MRRRAHGPRSRPTRWPPFASWRPAPRSAPKSRAWIFPAPYEDSERLLDALWTHATQPKYAWTHKWRVGDIVLWDNRCCMHYRTEVDVAQRRVMHRTTIKGDPLVAPWDLKQPPMNAD